MTKYDRDICNRIEDIEELEATATAYDDLMAGVFYEKHEQALLNIVNDNIGILNKDVE